MTRTPAGSGAAVDAAQQPEKVVLLNEDLSVAGTALKSDVHTADTALHLAFSLYLFDHHGRVLVTRRAADKTTWPGVWTNSCCGHPLPGEDVAAAVTRRAGQELGLLPDDVRLVLPSFRYRAVMDNGIVENEFCPVFVGWCEDPDAVRPDPDEVMDTRWVPWGQFRSAVLATSVQVSPWCELQVQQLPERVPRDR